jgi:hypothetical protein
MMYWWVVEGEGVLCSCSIARQLINQSSLAQSLHIAYTGLQVDSEAWSMSPLHVLPYFTKRLKKKF